MGRALQPDFNFISLIRRGLIFLYIAQLTVFEQILGYIKKYCTGTDKRLAELRSKYGDNPKIIERLRDYEDHIEAR